MYTSAVREEEAQNLVGRIVSSLERERKRQGLSQRALAQLARLDPKTVNLIERGARNPTLYTLALMADALGLRLAKVMEEAEGDPKNDENRV